MQAARFLPCSKSLSVRIDALYGLVTLSPRGNANTHKYPLKYVQRALPTSTRLNHLAEGEKSTMEQAGTQLVDVAHMGMALDRGGGT